MTIKIPNWFANLPSATGVDTPQLYDLWKTPVAQDNLRWQFINAVMKRYDAEPISDVRMLFPYDSEKIYAGNMQSLAEIYKKTPFQGKFLINGRNLLHIKVKVNEQAMRLGDTVFSLIDKPKDGLRTSRIRQTLNGSLIITHDDYAAYVTPYIEGRRPSASSEDRRNVGRGLGRLQAAFAALPGTMQKEIQKSSEAEIPRLSLGAQWILDDAYCAQKYPDYQKIMQDEARKYLDANRDEWAPNHYNMIIGDVLLDLENRLVVLDNERVADGWAPAGHDLGTGALRITLKALDDEGKELPVAINSLQPFLDGYNETSPVTLDMRGLLNCMTNSLMIGKIFGVASQAATGIHSGNMTGYKKLDRFVNMLKKPLQLSTQLGSDMA